MLIKTFASIAALSLALGGAAAVAADENRSSPNVGDGQQGSIFQQSDRPDEAAGSQRAAGDEASSNRPDISSQSGSDQQAASPSDSGGSMSSSSSSSMTNQSASSTLSSAQMEQDRDFVRQVQTKLKAEGYDVGTVDGMWGPRTQQALTSYQRDKGLEATGTLSTDLATALDIAPPGPTETAQQPALREDASEPMATNPAAKPVGPGGDTAQ